MMWEDFKAIDLDAAVLMIAPIPPSAVVESESQNETSESSEQAATDANNFRPLGTLLVPVLMPASKAKKCSQVKCGKGHFGPETALPMVRHA